jgi:UDP-3-O-[3-hydroxymyristoyl] glucosamine N-acyltransferase
MVEYGEIPAGQAIDDVNGCFVEVDEVTNRAFYVPSEITVYDREGSAMAGTFILNQANGSVVEQTSWVSPLVKLGKRVVVGSGVRVANHVTIGDGSFIEDRVRISEGVIMGEDCIVGRKSTIRKACALKSRAIISPRVWLDDRSYIASDVVIPSRKMTLPGTRIMNSQQAKRLPNNSELI